MHLGPYAFSLLQNVDQSTGDYLISQPRAEGRKVDLHTAEAAWLQTVFVHPGQAAYTSDAYVQSRGNI